MQIRLNQGMTSLAIRAKERRVELKLTQGQVAKTSGLKQPDISKIELGLIAETTKIIGLAKALKCRPEWLIDGKLPKESTSRSDTFQVSDNVSPYRSTPNYDQWTLGAIALMQSLNEHQREGALAALRTHVGHLGPPQNGQTLSMAVK